MSPEAYINLYRNESSKLRNQHISPSSLSPIRCHSSSLLSWRRMK